MCWAKKKVRDRLTLTTWYIANSLKSANDIRLCCRLRLDGWALPGCFREGEGVPEIVHKPEENCFRHACTVGSSEIGYELLCRALGHMHTAGRLQSPLFQRRVSVSAELIVVEAVHTIRIRPKARVISRWEPERRQISVHCARESCSAQARRQIESTLTRPFVDHASFLKVSKYRITWTVISPSRLDSCKRREIQSDAVILSTGSRDVEALTSRLECCQ